MEWAAGRARMGAAIFAPLHGALARLPAERWPTHAELTVLARGISTAHGKPLRFVAPRGREAPDDRKNHRERRPYELRIATSGEVETRPGSWHDLLNALVWIAFPQAKAAINAQHAAILEARGESEARRRSPERDALTLFDEGGVIVACTTPEPARLIGDFRWKELFWHRRAELQATTRFFAFGHACYEQALDPYIGMVAKTVFVSMEAPFPASPLAHQLAHADALVAAHFADPARFRSPKAMAPMPVLGVPGWYPQTDVEAFYDHTAYFRRKTPR